MPNAVIDLENVSLCYRLAKQRNVSIKEYLIHFVKGALVYEELWALENIDLRIQAGEVLGIIGPNGAGKSTLAKVIAGVMKPSRGKRQVKGTIAPILELGTGFDFELTGLENIYLNALMLGRRRREIERELDKIVTFSGLGDFIDAPMRNYSSGMIARLGFSIATAWVPSVLILDEVLAVGDVRFVARCQERIDSFREKGTTILLISHAVQMLLDYSTRCLWLEHGHVRGDGDPKSILDEYAVAMAPRLESVPEAAEDELGRSASS